MATFTSDAVLSENIYKPFPLGTLGVRVGEIEVAAGADVEDTASVYQMVPVFKGETVYHVILQTDALAASALVLDVGDGDVTDRYIDGATVGVAGGTASMGAADGAAPSATEFPRTYTASDTIDVVVQVAGVTGATGTIRVIAYIA